MSTGVVIGHAYDWIVKDKSTDDDRVAIHAWCLDRESNPFLLRFNNFPAFLNVELPPYVWGKRYNWDTVRADRLSNYIGNRLGQDRPERALFRMSRKLYYHWGDRAYPMLLLTFPNLKAAQHCQNLLNNVLKTEEWGMIMLKVWEADIGLERKLLTTRNLAHCQWFRVHVIPAAPDIKISTLKQEYIADWETLTGFSEDESRDWSTNPKTLSYDIECYSHKHRAMPDKYNALHVAYMISCIFQVDRKPETRRRFGIVYGDCNQIPPEKLDNCAIFLTDTEPDMIKQFGHLVQELDPEVLVGYNNLSFDNPYLDHRLKRLLMDWPQMGRLIGVTPVMMNKTWKSGAYGHNSLSILKMDGRLTFDLLPAVKRDHKLDKYDLDTVSKNFLGKGKHDVKPAEMFARYERLFNQRAELMNLLVSGVAFDGTQLQVAYYNCTSHLRHLVQLLQEKRQNLSTELQEKIKVAQEAYDKAKVEMTEVLDYCIRDSELVTDLFDMLNIWVGSIELSNIVGVTPMDIFTRGQQIRCVSQLYDLAARTGFVLDERDSPTYPFAGGAVQDPIPGLHENVVCLDFASLYPSIIQAFNVCFSTLIPPELANDIPDDQCYICDFEQDEEINSKAVTEREDKDDGWVAEDKGERKKKGPTRKVHYRLKFIKQPEGLLPKLVRELVARRRAVNRKIGDLKKQLSPLEKLEKALSGLRQPFAPIKDEKLVGVKEMMTQLVEAGDTHPFVLLVARCRVATHGSQEERDMLSSEIQAAISQLDSCQTERTVMINSLKLQITILDKRQLALKVSANSFFGFLGVRKGGRRSLIEGAMSITAWGRMLIGEVMEYVKNKYQGRIVYGDTDSIMVDLNIKDPKKCSHWGLKLSQEISGVKKGDTGPDGEEIMEAKPGLFNEPLAMAYEKSMRLFCLKKKKYAALMIDGKGNFKYTDKGALYILKKGIITARRDRDKYTCEVFSKILEMILTKAPFETALDCLIDAVQSLVDGKVPDDKLKVIRELGANYKSNSYFMKVFADEVRRQGKIVNPGDRLEFIIVKSDAKLLGHKMRLTETYAERLGTPQEERPDYFYYLEKSLKNPLDQLFQFGYQRELSILKIIGFKPSNRHKFISLEHPVKLMMKMCERGRDFRILKQVVRSNLYGSPMPPPIPAPPPPPISTLSSLIFEVVDDTPAPSTPSTPPVASTPQTRPVSSVASVLPILSPASPLVSPRVMQNGVSPQMPRLMALTPPNLGNYSVHRPGANGERQITKTPTFSSSSLSRELNISASPSFNPTLPGNGITFELVD
jgi:DNA polymerase elongation subunit (family B)